MKNAARLFVCVIWGAWGMSSGQGAGPCAHGSGPCVPDGCPVARHECVRVPSQKTIKKIVYDVKCVPVCEHRPAKFLATCDCCPVCQLKYKRVLIKREVIVGEVCGTTCVPVESACGPCFGGPNGAPPPEYAAPPVPPPARVSVEP